MKYESRRWATAEVAFVAMRFLVAGRLFWGTDGSLSLASLGQIIGASPPELASALACLYDEGLVRFEGGVERVRLTEHGLQELVS